MTITIRPAAEADQSTIGSIGSFIHQEKLNPRNLHWERFLLAEESGKIVGSRQVKNYKQGTPEVASGFVLPEYRRQGISSQRMNAILDREQGPLYLMCRDKRTYYYEPFVFRQLAVNELPADFRKECRIGKIVTSLLSMFSNDKVRMFR